MKPPWEHFKQHCHSLISEKVKQICTVYGAFFFQPHPLLFTFHLLTLSPSFHPLHFFSPFPPFSSPPPILPSYESVHTCKRVCVSVCVCDQRGVKSKQCSVWATPHSCSLGLGASWARRQISRTDLSVRVAWNQSSGLWLTFSASFLRNMNINRPTVRTLPRAILVIVINSTTVQNLTSLLCQGGFHVMWDVSEKHVSAKGCNTEESRMISIK